MNYVCDARIVGNVVLYGTALWIVGSVVLRSCTVKVDAEVDSDTFNKQACDFEATCKHLAQPKKNC